MGPLVGLLPPNMVTMLWKARACAAKFFESPIKSCPQLTLNKKIVGRVLSRKVPVVFPLGIYIQTPGPRQKSAVLQIRFAVL